MSSAGSPRGLAGLHTPRRKASWATLRQDELDSSVEVSAGGDSSVEVADEGLSAMYLGESRRNLKRSAKLDRQRAFMQDGVHRLHVRGIGVSGWDGTADGTGDHEDAEHLRALFQPFGAVIGTDFNTTAKFSRNFLLKMQR